MPIQIQRLWTCNRIPCTGNDVGEPAPSLPLNQCNAAATLNRAIGWLAERCCWLAEIVERNFLSLARLTLACSKRRTPGLALVKRSSKFTLLLLLVLLLLLFFSYSSFSHRVRLKSVIWPAAILSYSCSRPRWQQGDDHLLPVTKGKTNCHLHIGTSQFSTPSPASVSVLTRQSWIVLVDVNLVKVIREGSVLTNQWPIQSIFLPFFFLSFPRGDACMRVYVSTWRIETRQFIN